MLRQFGISDFQLDGFINNAIDDLNQQIKQTYDQTQQQEKQLNEFAALEKANQDKKNLDFFKILIKQVWNQDWQNKNNSELFYQFQKKISQMLAEKIRSAKGKATNLFKAFYETELLANKIKFNQEEDPYITFQKVLIAFLVRAFTYNVFSNEDYIKQLRAHYKKILLHYLRLKILEPSLGKANLDVEIAEKQRKFSELFDSEVGTILVNTNNSAKLAEIFVNKNQAAKVGKLLKILRDYREKPTELETQVEEFAKKDVNRWFGSLRVDTTSLGNQLQKEKFNPSLFEVNVEEKETTLITAHIKKDLNDLFNKALQTDSEISRQKIVKYCRDTIKLSDAECSMLEPVVHILTSPELKNTIDNNFEYLSLHFDCDLSALKTILALYQFLFEKFGGTPLWNEFQKCFAPNPTLSQGANIPLAEIKTLVSFQKKANFDEAIEATNESNKQLLLSLPILKSAAFSDQETHLCYVMNIQLLLAARLCYEKYKSIDFAIVKFIRQAQSFKSFYDFVAELNRLFLASADANKGVKEFAISLLKIFHDESFGLFTLITKNYKNYRELAYEQFFKRDLIYAASDRKSDSEKDLDHSDLRSTPHFEEFLVKQKKSDLKLNSSKAKLITKNFKRAAQETCETLSSLQIKLERLKVQKEKNNLFDFTLFATPVLNRAGTEGQLPQQQALGTRRITLH